MEDIIVGLCADGNGTVRGEVGDAGEKNCRNGENENSR